MGGLDHTQGTAAGTQDNRLGGGGFPPQAYTWAKIQRDSKVPHKQYKFPNKE